MIIVCHSCSARYKIRDELVADGPKRTKCKKCGAVMLIVPPPEGTGPEDEVLTRDGAAVAPSAPRPEPAAGPAPAAKAAPEPEPAAGRAPESEPEPAEKRAGEPGEEQPVESAEEKPEEAEDPLVKLEKRRQRMEDEISGRLHKAALETLEFKDLEELAEKIKRIEENPRYRPEKTEQLFTCLDCKTVYARFPDDPRVCSNCPGDAPLIRSEDIKKQYSMFRRL